MDTLFVTIVTFLFSLSSILISLASYNIAKNSLAITKNKENRHTKPLSYELIKGLYVNNSSDEILYIFIVLIKNASSSNNSILNVKLKVLYTDKSEFNRVAIYQHDPELVNKYKLSGFNFAQLNVHLNPYEANARAFIFKVSKDLIKNNYVDKYQLLFNDAKYGSFLLDGIIVSEYNME